MKSLSRPFPETSCIFHSKENLVVLFFPLAKVPYRISMANLGPGWSQLREVLESVIAACKSRDRNGEKDNVFYASVPITKEEWEWVLTFSLHQKTKTH